MSIKVTFKMSKNQACQVFSFPVENSGRKYRMRRPGIEPGSTAWKAAMLTTIPPTPVSLRYFLFRGFFHIVLKAK